MEHRFGSFDGAPPPGLSSFGGAPPSGGAGFSGAPPPGGVGLSDTMDGSGLPDLEFSNSSDFTTDDSSTYYSSWEFTTDDADELAVITDES